MAEYDSTINFRIQRASKDALVAEYKERGFPDLAELMRDIVDQHQLQKITRQLEELKTGL
jgi:hypothetical protein